MNVYSSLIRENDLHSIQPMNIVHSPGHDLHIDTRIDS
jgi:hypothetical protein